MRIETERLVIRDLERKDQEQLFKIVWQKKWCALCVIGQRIVLIQSLLMGMWTGISHRRILQMCMKVSDLKYLILTIDEANEASCRVAERAGFELFEKRYPISHKQPNMESDCYYYYRKYR